MRTNATQQNTTLTGAAALLPLCLLRTCRHLLEAASQYVASLQVRQDAVLPSQLAQPQMAHCWQVPSTRPWPYEQAVHTSVLSSQLAQFSTAHCWQVPSTSLWPDPQVVHTVVLPSQLSQLSTVHCWQVPSTRPRLDVQAVHTAALPSHETHSASATSHFTHSPATTPYLCMDDGQAELAGMVAGTQGRAALPMPAAAASPLSGVWLAAQRSGSPLGAR